MPNYKADLDWLKTHHPAEFARLPADLAASPQRHSTLHLSDDGSDEGLWTIAFLDATGDYITHVVLGIPRPPDEVDAIGYCADHTLEVSRAHCAAHHAWTGHT